LKYKGYVGAPGEITPGILPSALRAGLRPFKFAPGEFVELSSNLTMSQS